MFSGIGFESSTAVLNVGASDLRYRTITQPRIHELIHKSSKDEGADIMIDLASKDLSYTRI